MNRSIVFTGEITADYILALNITQKVKQYFQYRRIDQIFSGKKTNPFSTCETKNRKCVAYHVFFFQHLCHS